MTTYDWGERQERVDHLMEILGREPDRVADFGHAKLTHSELSDHIDKGTDIGREIVSVAGLVLFALSRDPELRETNERLRKTRENSQAVR